MSAPTFKITKLVLSQAPTEKAPSRVNHIVVVDVSGSMSGDLPSLRQSLKNKVLDLVRPQDTLSIVWFSGRSQYGVLLEDFAIDTVKDLQVIHGAIDRFLRPVGLTGFKEPLVEVGNLVKRLKAKRPDFVSSMFFMTDGQDNQWSQNEILDAVKALENEVAAATFVEYGWSCNRALLAKMAEACGGELIFDEDFPAYELSLTNQVVSPKLAGGKKVLISVPPSTQDFAFAFIDETVVTYSIVDGKVLVPEGLQGLYVFTPVGGDSPASVDETALLGALYVLSQRLRTDEIFQLLDVLGDVHLFKSFSNCFSKQDYINFQVKVMAAILDPAYRYVEGKGTDLVPDPDAFCVLNLLDLLTAEDENLVYPYHEAFEYKRIGAKRDQKDSVVTDAEVNALKDRILATTSVEDLKTLQIELDELLSKKEQLKFTVGDKAKGYPVNGLVFNEDRPNVSVRFNIQGTVELPDSRPASLPKQFPTYIWRNFTVIKDGIVNLSRLPVSLGKATFIELQKQGLIPSTLTYDPLQVYVLDYSELPVMNRGMVSTVQAKTLFEDVWQLEQLKAQQKVLNSIYKDNGFERASVTYEVLYGVDETAWLKERGITSYGGFNPLTVKGEDVDFYIAKELVVAIGGLSGLPKLSEVIERVQSGKPLTLSTSVMLPQWETYQKFEAAVKPITQPENWPKVLETWITAERDNARKQVRQRQVSLAKQKFAVIVGHAWFPDLNFDDPVAEFNGLENALPDKPVKFTVKLADKEIGGKAAD